MGPRDLAKAIEQLEIYLILLAIFVGLTALGVLACWRMPEAEQMVVG